MPFLENAFKHVSQSKKTSNWIRLSLQIEGQQLSFKISNSTKPEAFSSKEVMDYGGIGLKNVQRRLELLYPGKHQLDIQPGEQQFDIQLQLQLKTGQQSVDETNALPTTVLESSSFQYSS